MSQGRDRTLAMLVQVGLLIVATVCLLGAAFHALGWAVLSLDETAVKLLAISLVALGFGQITKFKGFGIEIEKQVAQLSDNLGKLEKEVGPGSKSAVAPSAVVREMSPPPERHGLSAVVDPADPNKGQFGGRPESNGRRLSARITPVSGDTSSRCRVTIRVESTDPQRPIEGHVKLHLHPTFGHWALQDIPVIGGVAKEEIVSYGAFTIGAVVADGTMLELDLADVPGGTKRFYEE